MKKLNRNKLSDKFKEMKVMTSDLSLTNDEVLDKFDLDDEEYILLGTKIPMILSSTGSGITEHDTSVIFYDCNYSIFSSNRNLFTEGSESFDLYKCDLEDDFILFTVKHEADLEEIFESFDNYYYDCLDEDEVHPETEGHLIDIENGYVEYNGAKIPTREVLNNIDTSMDDLIKVLDDDTLMNKRPDNSVSINDNGPFHTPIRTENGHDVRCSTGYDFEDEILDNLTSDVEKLVKEIEHNKQNEINIFNI